MSPPMNPRNIAVWVSLAAAVVSPVVSTVWTVSTMNTKLAVIEERIINMQENAEKSFTDTVSLRVENSEIRLKLAEIDKRLSILESQHK